MGRCIFCLQELPVFEGLSGEDFNNVCLSSNKIWIPKGTFLIRQGDFSSAIYLIKQGKLKLVQLTADGRELIIDILGPGEVLGDTSLFQDRVTPFSVLALDDVKLCSFSKELFEKLITENPRVAIQIINYLSGKLHTTIQQAGDSTGATVRNKLLKLFIRLSGEYGIRKKEETLIDLKLTQQEIADMIGASRVMVAQKLKELKDNKIIGRQGKYYTLYNDPCIEENFA